MILFPVLIPGQKFLFPGMGREITKCHGKGREIWGLYSWESRETEISAHPWFLGDSGVLGRVYRGFAGVVGVCGGVQCSCQMRKEGSTAAVARRRSHRPLTPLTQTLSKTAQCASASSFFYFNFNIMESCPKAYTYLAFFIDVVLFEGPP